MDYTQTVTYLLYGVAGLGGLLALIVLVMAILPPKLEEYEDDSDFGTFEDASYDEYDNYDDADEYDAYNQADYYSEEEPKEDYPPEDYTPEEKSDGVIILPVPGGVISAPSERKVEPPQTEALAKEPPERPPLPIIGFPPIMTLPEDDVAEAEEEIPSNAAQLERVEAPAQNTKELSDTASIPVQDGAMKVGNFMIRLSIAQDIGARAEQQDAMEIGPTDPESIEKNGFICVLCDGMGGMKMGGDAAILAAKSFIKECLDSGMPLHTAMVDAARVANDRVWALCRADDLSGAGTTLVSACIDAMGLSFVSVGDSHIYLLRSGILSQLNIDHNYLTELLLRVRQGEMSRQQALSDPERSHLTSYLGMRSLSLIDRSGEPLALESGDIILLASDGLFKVLTQKEITSHLHSFDPKCANRLVDDILRRRFRNQDNVSVIVISVE